MLLGGSPLIILTIAKGNTVCPDDSRPNLLI